MCKTIKNTEDCIGCILYPLLILGSFCGSPPILISCTHFNKQSYSSVQFCRSQTFSYFATFIVLLLIISIVMYVDSLFRSYGKTNVALVLVEIFFLVGGITCSISGITKANQKITELSGLEMIIKQRKYYGFQNLIDTNTKKSFLKKTYILISFIIIVEFIFIVSYFIQNYEEQNATDIFFLLILLMNNFIESVTLFQTVMAIHLYNILFRKCFLHIKTGLRKRITVQRYFDITRLHKFYSNLVINYKQLDIYINPTFTLMLCILIILLIINIFILTSAAGSIILNLRVYGSIFAIVLYLMVTESVNVINYDMLTFLYKFPISKLSKAEAAQVETLITTLNIQKPVLRASDMFNIGTGTLTSICGTIVTYVLVAVQFKDEILKIV